MLHLKIAAVGKIKERYLREGIAEYQKRLRPYVRLVIEEVPDEPLGKEPHKAAEVEGNRLLEKIGPAAYVAALDRQGREFSSEELASWFAAREMEGREVVLTVGGASGLSPSVLARAEEKISFSRLTFPHQLFRLLLLEQIYRAYKILRGEPYHW